MTLPTISVIIPAFNAQSCISKAIDSVLGQGFPGTQVIVSPDDGQSYEWLGTKYPAVVKVLSSSVVRSGAGEARNRGLAESRADFVAVLDADDFWLPGVLPELVRLAEEDGLAFLRTNATTPEGAPIRIAPLHGPRFTLENFASAVCSVKPLLHRSLEQGYPTVLAEDVVHDGILMATRSSCALLEQGYVQVVAPSSTMAASGENRIQHDYLRIIDSARNCPATFGFETLSVAQRERMARLFEFRLFVSGEFDKSGQPGYEQWVAGQEMKLFRAWSAPTNTLR